MLRILAALPVLLLATHMATANTISCAFHRGAAAADPVGWIPADAGASGGAALRGALQRPYIMVLNDAAGDLAPWKYHPELSSTFEQRFLALSARQPAYLIAERPGPRPAPLVLTGRNGAGAVAVWRAVRLIDLVGTARWPGTLVSLPVGAGAHPAAAPPVAPVPLPGGAAGLGFALGGLALWHRVRGSRLRGPSAESWRSTADRWLATFRGGTASPPYSPPR